MVFCQDLFHPFWTELRPGFRNSLSKVNIHIMGEAPAGRALGLGLCQQFFSSRIVGESKTPWDTGTRPQLGSREDSYWERSLGNRPKILYKSTGPEIGFNDLQISSNGLNNQESTDQLVSCAKSSILRGWLYPGGKSFQPSPC